MKKGGRFGDWGHMDCYPSGRPDGKLNSMGWATKYDEAG